MAGDKLRLLGLMRPAMAILPEISQPEKKVNITLFIIFHIFAYRFNSKIESYGQP